jgi:predicted transcriptional regulator
MVQITIVTTPEEQQKVLEAIKTVVGKTVAVSEISRIAGLNQNRVRYVITDLESSGKIVRIPTREFNSHYIRYKYEVPDGQ